MSNLGLQDIPEACAAEFGVTPTARESQSDLFAGADEIGPDRLSDVPPFAIAGVTWRCWVTDGGQRYEWRSEDGGLAAARGNRAFWARAGRRLVGDRHPTLRAAMAAAIGAAGRAAA